MEYGVWETCALPAGRHSRHSLAISCSSSNAMVDKRRVRWQQGLDFDETFAPVCLYRSVRMMLAVSAHEGLEFRQFDICTASLNGELPEEVYLWPPAGAEHLAGGPGRVLRLRRALYGLRQASRAWTKRLKSELTAKGFGQSNDDPSLWILHGEHGAIMAMLYVDDGLVAARTAEEADALVDLVASMFATRKLGEPQDFHGIEVSRDRDAGTISICHKREAESLAAIIHVVGTRKAMPMSPEVYGEIEPYARVTRWPTCWPSTLASAACFTWRSARVWTLP
jgi:hypothetical protein